MLTYKKLCGTVIIINIIIIFRFEENEITVLSGGRDMNEQEVKETLSKILYGITDMSVQNIVRNIIFDNGNDIDWNKTMEIIKEQRPDMR